MQGLALRLVAPRCPDGVELVRLDRYPKFENRYGESGPDWFAHRSDRERIETIREQLGLQDALVVRFINATNDDRRVAFFSRFGLAGMGLGATALGMRRSEPRNLVLGEQTSLRHLLERAGSGNPAIAIKAASEALHFFGRVTVSLETGEAPQLVLSALDPLEFMHLEVATVAANGARFATCETCGDVFLTGPLTARRSTARYCRDRCRVNAHREKARSGGNHVG